MPPPSRLKMAGNRVRAAKTDATTTNMTASPIPMNTLEGTSNKPMKPSTTVIPLKTTVRLAVAPARAMASILSRPLERSSRYRDRTNNE